MRNYFSVCSFLKYLSLLILDLWHGAVVGYGLHDGRPGRVLSLTKAPLGHKKRVYGSGGAQFLSPCALRKSISDMSESGGGWW